MSARFLSLDGGILVAFVSNITEQRKAERLLIESEEKYKNLFTNMIDVAYRTNAEGLIEYISPSCEALFGYAPADVEGKMMKDLYLDPSQREDFLQELSLKGKVEDYRARVRRKDGSICWVSTNAKMAYNENGSFAGVEGITRDISRLVESESAREKAEAQLAQAQKMEAVGTLAGGIAHDFNNILGAILGYTELTLSALPPDSEERENLQEVLVASGRAKELVKQILAFGRKGEKKVVSVDSGLLVNEAMKLLVSVIPKTIKIERELDLGAGHVLADPTELHQVVMNLCTNAYQAMPEEKGILHVRLSSAVIEPLEASSVPGLSPGEYVRLEVIDNGYGMDQQTLARIFEPYFTTKAVGKGTGLGLALVHGIVTAVGGAIAVRSTPGIGTSFVVYLPRTEPVQEEAVDQKDIASLRGMGKVLVVDDEPALARLAGKMLESLGYKVRLVNDPLEAIRVFESDPQGFDAIVTDQTMPGMTGAELVRRAKLAKPAVAAVMCTGYSDLIDEDGAKKIGVAAYVQKPYDRNRLGAALAAALGQHT